MTTFIDALRTKDSYTENGCLANSTSLDYCLDYFYIAGNRNSNIELFKRAFFSNPDLALKILFWSRDCRGGAGNRMNFMAVMKYLQSEQPEVFSSIFKFIPEYGYWKDIFNLNPTDELVRFVASELTSANSHSLCAKYCPRKGVWVGLLRKELKMSPSEFRHFVVSKTQVVEQLMCSKKWEEIVYESVPSVANLRYSRAFGMHDTERYRKYISDVNSNKTTIHSSQLFPYQIYDKWDNGENNATIRALWNNLPNYMEGNTERVIPVCDVSGSMWDTPLSISVSLGCYISERNTGPFKDAFITFSERPTLKVLSGSITDRFNQLKHSPWGMNTDLQAVFELILNQAVKHSLPESEMPTMILIISD